MKSSYFVSEIISDLTASTTEKFRSPPPLYIRHFPIIAALKTKQINMLWQDISHTLTPDAEHCVTIDYLFWNTIHVPSQIIVEILRILVPPIAICIRFLAVLPFEYLSGCQSTIMTFNHSSLVFDYLLLIF